jgi:hypothetical protein
MCLMSTRAIDDAQPAHLANMSMRSEGSDIGLRSTRLARERVTSGIQEFARLSMNLSIYAFPQTAWVTEGQALEGNLQNQKIADKDLLRCILGGRVAIVCVITISQRARLRHGDDVVAGIDKLDIASHAAR